MAYKRDGLTIGVSSNVSEITKSRVYFLTRTAVKTEAWHGLAIKLGLLPPPSDANSGPRRFDAPYVYLLTERPSKVALRGEFC